MSSSPLFDATGDAAGGADAAPFLLRGGTASDCAAPRAPLPAGAAAAPATSPRPCRNTAAEINAQLDTQVEVRVYPCNHNNGSGPSHPPPKKKFTQFHVKPEGVIIQGAHRGGPGPHHHRDRASAPVVDLGGEYAAHLGRQLPRYELSDTRACQLLVTAHHKSFWVVPAPEAFSRHSGTCRLLGDRKHPPTAHALRVGDFLRVGSVGVVVIETHNGREQRVLSEERIRKIMRDTTGNGAGFLDLAETDGESSDESLEESDPEPALPAAPPGSEDAPTCYMCFDGEDTPDNPLITPCKCAGDTKYVHVGCLRKWHTAESDNQVCFLSSVDATCSVCKTTFKSDFKLKDGRLVKLFKSSLEPPYVSLLVATKHEMAQSLFNTRFQLSFRTLLKPDGRNGTRPLLLGRSSGSDMVLDYRTVSARHAALRLKDGAFLFTDAGSSNGSYLYLRRPVELNGANGRSVQFRLGRTMISMKVVSRWNKRLLRAVTRRTGLAAAGSGAIADDDDDGDDDGRSVGRREDDGRAPPRRTRGDLLAGLPPRGTLSQRSAQHLDLLRALACPHPAPAAPPKLAERRADEDRRTGAEAPQWGEHERHARAGPRAAEAPCPVGALARGVHGLELGAPEAAPAGAQEEEEERY